MAEETKAKKPLKKEEKKPWEEDVFDVRKPQPKPTPTPRADTARETAPAGPVEEAEETLRDIRKRNEELVRRYGEGKKKKPTAKKDSKKQQSSRR